MTRHQAREEELRQQLSELPPELRKAFAIHVAEQVLRLWTATGDERAEAAQTQRELADRLGMASRQGSADLERLVPDEDDEWSLGIGLQGNAVLAVISALRCLEDGDPIHCLQAVRQAGEAAELIDGQQVEGSEFTEEVEQELWEGDHARRQRKAQDDALAKLRRSDPDRPLAEMVDELRVT